MEIKVPTCVNVYVSMTLFILVKKEIGVMVKNALWKRYNPL